MRKLFWAVVASALLFNPASLSAHDSQPSGYFINTNLIKQLVCKEQDGGIASGTAFYINSHTLITAEHVVADSTCEIDGKPVTMSEENVKLDYAIVKTAEDAPDPSEVLNWSCDHFNKGETYLAVGYAFGEDLVVQSLRGSNMHEDQEGFADETRLIGNDFPGMSGGPIFDSRGYVVGIVNGGDKDGRSSAVSRELGQTSLCKR